MANGTPVEDATDADAHSFSAISADMFANPYDYWALRLLIILVGYASVLLPGFFLIRFVKRRYYNGDRYFYRNHPNSCLNFLTLFAVGRPEDAEHQLLPTNPDGPRSSKSNENLSSSRSSERFFRDCSLLFIYSMGIQVTLVCMGFMQERIMTGTYANVEDPTLLEKFGDAQFLVLLNRLWALAICGAYLLYDWRRQPPHVPPLYKYSFISISNTLSTWCQYEALKYVSFPTQTVCKAAKLIPTMLMGRLVRGERYSKEDYGIALGLVSGAAIFFLSNQSAVNTLHKARAAEQYTTISGVILMLGYLAFDAFTPNWQKKLFDTRPKISRYQMMVGVNTFSAILCLVSLLEQGTLFSSLSFMFSHEGFSRDSFLLSISGAIGQLFIYATIEKFGPVVFAVIMTVRQIFSIVLSSMYFSHAMSITGVFGLMVVFGSIFVDTYRKYFAKSRR